MSCDDELANEWARCSGKNASYITIKFMQDHVTFVPCQLGRLIRNSRSYMVTETALLSRAFARLLQSRAKISAGYLVAFSLSN